MIPQGKGKFLFGVIVLIGLVLMIVEFMKVPRSARVVLPNNGDIPIEIAIENQVTTGDVTSTATSSNPKPVLHKKASGSAEDRLARKSNQYDRAKEISTPDGFINTNSDFKIANLIGKKVVLVDFWTYSCINCQRTTPYLNAWYEKYSANGGSASGEKDQGLEIVGVHTPEFQFEKNYENVVAAVKKENIKYPVVLDNDYSTWTAYQNRFWPHRYLIDIDGFIVFDQIGEGGYDVMERQIQLALAERSLVLGLNQTIRTDIANPQMTDMLSNGPRSPETYFGASRNESLANGASGIAGDQILPAPTSFFPNSLYLVGSWSFTNEYAENKSAGAKIVYPYQAGHVYFVASASSPVKIKILRDGVPLTTQNAGADVTVSENSSTAIIQEDRLYKLVNESEGGLPTEASAKAGVHTLEIEVENPGLKAFTFTFG